MSNDNVTQYIFFAFLIIIQNFSEKSYLLRLIISHEKINFAKPKPGTMREKLCCFVKDNTYTKGLVIGESLFTFCRFRQPMTT